MPVDHRDPRYATYASKSDAELRALEKDPSLSADEWQAVTEELYRRSREAPPDPAPPPAAPPRPSEPAPSAAGAPEPEDARITGALEHLRAILLPGETLESYAVQRRLFALTHRRVLVAATSGRFISLARGLLGGYTMFDVRWQDLRDARLYVGIFGADLGVTALVSDDLASTEDVGGNYTFVGLRKAQAQSVYRVCQAREQAWREKRRVRDLAELRAKSGGVQFGGAGLAAAGGGASAADGGDPVERLRRAKEMLDSGLITDAEYESLKARIVDGL